MLAFLTPWLCMYDATIFHRREYVPGDASLPTAFIWPPAIDPLAPKNMALSLEDARYIIDQFGIDVDRPLLTQVSRFDPWKDPLGVIDAYRAVHVKRPEVQLALVGSMAHDDPEGWDFYNQTVAYAGGDDRHLHPLEPEQRRLRRGQRLPGDVGGRDPEVDPRGLRAHGLGGALEGTPGRGGRVGGIVSQVETAAPASSSALPRNAPRRAWRSSRSRAGARMALAGKEYVRGTS